MSYKIIECQNASEVEDVLNGSVVSGKALPPGTRIYGLHGLTLLIRGSTVTFSDASGAGLTIQAIKTAIEAGVAGLTVMFKLDRIILRHASGVTITKTGTANTAFGFDVSVDTVGTVYNPSTGAKPRWWAVSPGTRQDSYFTVVEV